MAKKYYEGYVKIDAYITYGVHADSRDEAYKKILDYLNEESLDMGEADWDTYDLDPDYVEEQDRPSSWEVVNIDEEDE